MNPSLAGAGLGLLAASGLVLAVAYSPPLRRPTLEDRLAPYLRDELPRSRLLAEPRGRFDPGSLVGRLVRRLAGLADQALGGAASVRRRLEAAGDERSVGEFREAQVLWGAAGFAVGLLLDGVAAARGTANPLALLLVCCCATGAGLLARDRALSREVRRREERMLAEFPTVAELLALAVSAGEGPLGALERVTRLGSGELCKELRRSVAEVRSGVPLTAALQSVSRRSSLTVLTRFVDGMVIAIERGTPLADVLRAQALDVREAGKRALLEAAGRREIAMLVPVVFLILPVVVLFALFPGFYTLNVTAP